jgi:UDP-2-acetamido-2,6-beta-L-arabino-hexul-4-ose reductase
MKVLVTGADGFIGKNLAVHLAARDDVEMMRYVRGSTEDALRQAMSSADFVIHLAGVNRPEDTAEFTTGNAELTAMLCREMAASGRRIPVIFASTVHAGRDDAYGASKLAAEQILLQYAKESGAPVCIFRLPGVFGKWCRPNYNSVVATFCHNIARDLPIRIDNPDSKLSLVYIDDVLGAFTRIMEGEISEAAYCDIKPVYDTTVGEVAGRIRAFRATRDTLVSERVGTGFLHALYSTYISYLPPERFTYELPRHEDARGVFAEVLKTADSGQFSFFTAHAGQTRGGHYHHSKTEKFLVLKGRAKFRFRHLVTNELHEICTSGEKPEIVETIPGWVHDVANIGDHEMIVMLWANEIFDHEHPDTYSAHV